MRPFVAALVGLLAVACGPTAVSLQASPSPTLRTYPAQQSSASPTPQPGIPVRLQVPSLGIDSPTMQVGLMADGSVGTPCDPTKPRIKCDTNATAWFEGSVRPGAPGSAVEDGHVDWFGPAGSNHDVPAVFAHLDRIKLGAQITVLDNKGQAHVFVVDRITTLAYPQQPPDTYDQFGPSRLMLITCKGVYVSRSTGMSQRLYVRATLSG